MGGKGERETVFHLFDYDGAMYSLSLTNPPTYLVWSLTFLQIEERRKKSEFMVSCFSVISTPTNTNK